MIKVEYGLTESILKNGITLTERVSISTSNILSASASLFGSAKGRLTFGFLINN